MNIAQKNHQAALLLATGYEDKDALTVRSSDGDIPHGREISFSWLAGIIMTGLTSVLLMGAALYVSFLGQDTFSTPFRALNIELKNISNTPLLKEKTNRQRPITLTRSDKETVEAAIKEEINGRSIVKKQPFVRIKATLATAATALSDNIPTYDPVALLSRTQKKSNAQSSQISTEIYSANVEGEIAVKTSALSINSSPKTIISDQAAAQYVSSAYSDISFDGEIFALGYVEDNTGVRELDKTDDENTNRNKLIIGKAENVSIIAQSQQTNKKGFGRSERILTVKETSLLEDVLLKNGFTEQMIKATTNTLRNVYPSTQLSKGTRLRILFGPSKNSNTLVPYRMSIYIREKHAATVALTDSGKYVLGLAPPSIDFPDEDIEEINVNNLPSIYRSIWETARKHDLSDQNTDRIIAMFAYDLDLTKKISPGDSIEILQTEPNEKNEQQLLYVALKLGKTERKFYRYRTDNGEVDFYDSNGQTGKRFLTRRPLKGGGNLRSRFGYRRHPITGRTKLHTGTDLAAPYGTPVYASGDGIIDMAQWFSGYGRYVKLKHVNGFTTAYAHMSKIAKGMAPGGRVRQGQIIGYVGSTGQSTGNHLHFEMRINNRPVDALSVKLPRDKVLPQQYQNNFKNTIAQINDLMKREPAPVKVANN